MRDEFFLVCDGLKGLPDVVANVWTQTIVQTCIVHLIRNTFRLVSRRDWDAVKREITGPGGGPSDYSGLVWLTETDIRSLSSPRLESAYAMHLRLADPAGAPAFKRSFRHGDDVRLHLRAWQDLSAQDAKVFRDTEPTLFVGGWLLAMSAEAGAAVLASHRASEQTRRAGLLKAVGATPGVVSTVLLAEYLLLGLTAAGLGIATGRLVTPAVAGPNPGLLDTDLPITTGTVLPVLVLALLIALAGTAGRPSARRAPPRCPRSPHRPAPSTIRPGSQRSRDGCPCRCCSGSDWSPGDRPVPCSTPPASPPSASRSVPR